MTLRTLRMLLTVRAFVPLTLLALITTPIPTVHAQEQLWIKQFGTTGSDWLQALTPDGTGGVFVGGTTSGSLGGANAGFDDAYLARYDSEGNQIWIVQFGTSVDDSVLALVHDGKSGVFVGGHTWGSLGGPNAGDGDAYLAHYDGDGVRTWISQFGSVETESVRALALDNSGGVFVAGRTWGNLGGANAGVFDVFLARFDDAGRQIWITQYGSSESDMTWDLAPDGMGGVFVCGLTEGDLGGPNVGGNDAYLAHYDGNGGQTWIRQFGTSEGDDAYGLVSDGSNGVFVVGNTHGSLGGPTFGRWDIYLAHYSSEGAKTWIRQFGTNRSDFANSLAFDGINGLFIGGSTTGRFGGPFTGSPDAFVLHCNTEGSQFRFRQFGTVVGNEGTRALAPDGTGGVYVGGFTGGDLGGPNAGSNDVFIARYDSSPPCYADRDQSTGVGVLDIFDFLSFQNGFVNREPDTCNCDITTGVVVCDIFDFLCFQSAFVAGCP